MAAVHQVTAPHFTAGLTTKAGLVTHAAPIIRYMTGWPMERVESYCRSKGWRVVKVEPKP